MASGILITRDEFIARSTIVHNGKFDYSEVTYVNASTKVTIICPTHGSFSQRADDHLRGRGCRLCRRTRQASHIIFDGHNQQQ